MLGTGIDWSESDSIAVLVSTLQGFVPLCLPQKGLYAFAMPDLVAKHHVSTPRKRQRACDTLRKCRRCIRSRRCCFTKWQTLTVLLMGESKCDSGAGFSLSTREWGCRLAACNAGPHWLKNKRAGLGVQEAHQCHHTTPTRDRGCMALDGRCRRSRTFRNALTHSRQAPIWLSNASQTAHLFPQLPRARKSHVHKKTVNG